MRQALMLAVGIFFFLLLGFIGGIPAVSAAPKAEWAVKWDRLVDGARKEGSLSLYATAWPPECRTALTEAFKKKYGINVDFSSFSRGAELAAKYSTERNAGLKIADIFGAGPPTLTILLKPKGFLAPLEPLLILPEVTNPKAWEIGKVPYLEKDKVALAMIGGVQPSIMYNATLIKQGEITSYRDLLRPQYKGKITINDPSTTGAGNAFMAFLAHDVWNVKEAGDFLRQLLKQQEAFVQRDNRLNVEEVARGKFAIGIAPNRTNAAKHIELGSQIAFASPKEGSFVVPPSGAIAVSTTPAHPNAAAVFLNWVLTREGQTVFAQSYGNPSIRLDTPKEGFPSLFFAQPGERVIYHIEDSEQFVKLQEEMIEVARKIMAETTK